jgi:cysteinyl-tRNA synthetase
MSAASIPSEDVIAILRSREDARKNGDWQTADRLREDLLVKGWTVKDTPDGPKLEPLG